MKIAIISDIHDNLANLEKCLNWCSKNSIAELICCGDVTNSETLKFLSNKFNNKIHLVKGNAEIYDEKEIKKYDNIKYYGRVGHFVIDNKKIGICHEPYLIKQVGTRRGASPHEKCDIIFYGHTHKPWIEKKNNATIVNPGTLGSVFSKATFAVFNSANNEIELKILELI